MKKIPSFDIQNTLKPAYNEGVTTLTIMITSDITIKTVNIRGYNHNNQYFEKESICIYRKDFFSDFKITIPLYLFYFLLVIVVITLIINDLCGYFSGYLSGYSGYQLDNKGFFSVFPPLRDLMKWRKGFIDAGKRLNLSKVEKFRLKHKFTEPILSYLFCTLKRILLTNNKSLKFDTFLGMLKLTPVKFNAVLKS